MSRACSSAMMGPCDCARSSAASADQSRLRFLSTYRTFSTSPGATGSGDRARGRHAEVGRDVVAGEGGEHAREEGVVLLDAAIRLDVFLPVMAEQRLMRGGQALEVGLPPMHPPRRRWRSSAWRARSSGRQRAPGAHHPPFFAQPRPRRRRRRSSRPRLAPRVVAPRRQSEPKNRRTPFPRFDSTSNSGIDDPAASSEAPARLPIQTRRRHRAEPAWASI